MLKSFYHLPIIFPFAFVAKTRQKMHNKVITLVSFLAISLPCFAQNGAIEGRITNRKNKSVPGTVTLSGHGILLYRTITDKHGRYHIDDIVPGYYEAEASPNIYDYRDRKDSIRIEAGKKQQLDFRLLPKILNKRK